MQAKYLLGMNMIKTPYSQRHLIFWMKYTSYTKI